ncbi:hypothetical protein IE53DRAFT_385671, partial [Violaceomyces palustris]
MGVTTTARLPTISAQSIPALFNHLQSHHNAKVISRWSITIRSFRAVPVPIPADQEDASDKPSSSSSALSSSVNENGHSDAKVTKLTNPRTMWQVTFSEYPGVVFVLVEDMGRKSRATIRNEWEDECEKFEADFKEWRRIERLRLKKLRQRERASNQKEVDSDQDGARETTNVTGAQEVAEKGGETLHERREDLATASQAFAETTTTSEQVTMAGASAEDRTRIEKASSAVSTFEKRQDETEDLQKAIPPPDLPKLKLPSHTRFTLSTLSSSLPLLVNKLSLPAPLGAPSGTAGPGAWVPRGTAVNIEGVVMQLGTALFGDSSGSSGPSSVVNEDASGSSDWKVRVGSVVAGGGRSAGAVIEAEFLPLTDPTPTSAFLQNFVQSLFPPHLLGMPSSSATSSISQAPNLHAPPRQSVRPGFWSTGDPVNSSPYGQNLSTPRLASFSNPSTIIGGSMLGGHVTMSDGGVLMDPDQRSGAPYLSSSLGGSHMVAAQNNFMPTTAPYPSSTAFDAGLLNGVGTNALGDASSFPMMATGSAPPIAGMGISNGFAGMRHQQQLQQQSLQHSQQQQQGPLIISNLPDNLWQEVLPTSAKEWGGMMEKNFQEDFLECLKKSKSGQREVGRNQQSNSESGRGDIDVAKEERKRNSDPHEGDETDGAAPKKPRRDQTLSHSPFLFPAFSDATTPLKEPTALKELLPTLVHSKSPALGDQSKGNEARGEAGSSLQD